ncbi:Esterase-like activity of phytase [compost metagenome]
MHRALLTLALAMPGVCLAAEATTACGLQLLGEQRIPLRLPVAGTPVGGLSGIDFDARRGDWIAISDDRSELAPARAYRLAMAFSATALDSLEVTRLQMLRQADSSPYPNRRQGGEVPDFEAIRVDPRDDSLWYTSEGDRALGQSPSLRQANTEGNLLRVLPLPEMFSTHPQREQGVRDNQSFEGLSFSADGDSLWLAMEGPLYQDSAPSTIERGALLRFTQLDRQGRPLRQVAYPLEPLPAGERSPHDQNGVAEILALDDERLLVLERTILLDPRTRKANSLARLFVVELKSASDIQDLPTLEGQDFRPLHKRQLLDIADLGLAHQDMLEGMAWGPPLPDGRRSLLLVSDDNFDQFGMGQVTQVLALAVGEMDCP